LDILIVLNESCQIKKIVKRLVDGHVGGLSLVLQRKPFAFELFFCLANVSHRSKVITNAWFYEELHKY